LSANFINNNKTFIFNDIASFFLQERTCVSMSHSLFFEKKACTHKKKKKKKLLELLEVIELILDALIALI